MIKTEGFKVPGAMHLAPRPAFGRPFSNGSMTVETDMLASIDHCARLAMTSSFSVPNPLSDSSMFDHYLDQNASSHATSYHPGSFLDGFKFGHSLDNPEPPIKLPVDERVRSQSASGPSNIGKAPLSRVHPPRKLSLSEARRPCAGSQTRGGLVQTFGHATDHNRTMSHSDVSASRLCLAMGLDTRKEGERTDSISPIENGKNEAYDMSIARTAPGETVSWGSNGTPSLVSGSLGSYGGNNEDAIMGTPVTPAHLRPSLAIDDSYKKQRRRECHNQVEKRRREHINAKIDELSELLPPTYSQNEEVVGEDDVEDDNTESPLKKKKTKRSSSKSQKEAVQCKGRILSSSVQYIHDLRQITEMQTARIQHLEGLLMSTGLSSMSQAPFSWSTPTTSELAPFQTELPNQLQVMRPSPEPPVWTTGVIAYEPSPTDLSSNSVITSLRRSSSSSTHPESTKGHQPSPMNAHSQSPGGPGPEDMRGRRSERAAMKDSAMEIQVSMSGMELDGLFAGARREEAGGMRW